jgi:putative beta-lysine N-acetyltransferase
VPDPVIGHDLIELFHGALIQHGTFNNRIYLMKIKDANPNDLAPALLEKARENRYTKVLVKIPHETSQPFLNLGYVQEAEIPNLYSGKQSAIILAYYLSKNRKLENNRTENEKVYRLSIEKQVPPESIQKIQLENNFSLHNLTQDDVPEISALYNTIFSSYPFPINESSFLAETMESHVDYFGIKTDGELIALSSLEKDTESLNAEMTDFATLPKWQGFSLAKYLLVHMEKEARLNGLKTAYTIARAESPGMNIVFTKNAYQYGGRLINNTHISGHIESMNIWYKAL